MRKLPAGGEIYFPAKQIIDFTIETTQPVYVTADGAEGTPLSEALIAVVLCGWQFEVITT